PEAHQVVDLRPGAALLEKGNQLAILVGVVDGMEATGPPMALLVDVGAGAQQYVDHLAVAPLRGDDERRLAKAVLRKRRVDLRFQIGLRGQDAGQYRRVIRSNGLEQRHRQPGMRNAPLRDE